MRRWLVSVAALLLGNGAGVLRARDGVIQSPVVFEHNVPMQTSDGVTLYADLYSPRSDGRFPVLLERTAYDKGTSIEYALDAVARGYIVAVQDVRGRYASEGEWYPLKYEADDGFAAVAWAAALPHADGRVGMFGSSYNGATQLLAAIRRPPALAGICPTITSSNFHDNGIYQGGAFELGLSESWSSLVSQNALIRKLPPPPDPGERSLKPPPAGYSVLDLSAFASANPTALLAPFFRDWLDHPGYDDYWKRWSIEEHYGDINVPALTVAGWYDIFLGGSLRNYLGLSLHAGSDGARHGQHLLVVPGGHAGNGRIIGDVDFGPASEFHEDAAALDWYDYLFKGAKNEFSHGPVTIFVMGLNQWRQETEWPPARVRYSRYFLHSRGAANSAGGNGRLSTDAPKSEPADRYVYDPANPVGTIGGPLCCDESRLEPGARDQRPAEIRNDVLVYSTNALVRDLEVTGPVSVELYAASTAVDTDFTAKLVDVSPDGFARNVTEGIVRARYRDSPERATLLHPDQPYRFKIDLWATSNIFLAGHLLRLEVASSNFPRFSRNLNVAEQPESGVRFTSATNLVFHDADHPSALILPVIPAIDHAGPTQSPEYIGRH